MHKIIQISDTHIFADENHIFNGIKPVIFLKKAISIINDNFNNIDAFFITGDLVHGGNEQAYEVFKTLNMLLPANSYWLPGNHDDINNLYKAGTSVCAVPYYFNEQYKNIWPKTFELCANSPWIIHFLNSHTGFAHGELGDEQITNLANNIQQNQDRFHLIALHHPPINLNSPWLDKDKLRDGEKLLQLLANLNNTYHNVKVMIWGHAHNIFEHTMHNIKMLGCPSVCLPFKWDANEFCTTEQTRGFRYLELLDDGTITTEIIEIK